jgi:hypothetical protein
MQKQLFKKFLLYVIPALIVVGLSIYVSDKKKEKQIINYHD